MTTPNTLPTFYVYAPDYTDGDGYSRRLAVREKHLERTTHAIKSGYVKFGGALLSPESLDEAGQVKPDRKLTGSTLVVQDKSIQAVREWVEGDPYYINNVWDKEKLVITPIIVAHPSL